MSEYGSIVFLSRDWLPVALGVAVFVTLVSLWGYSRARLPLRLKLAGITNRHALAVVRQQGDKVSPLLGLLPHPLRLEQTKTE